LYSFELRRGGPTTVCKPAAPGITGGVTVEMVGDMPPREFLTPGAEEARAKMFGELKTLFARKTTELLAMDETGEGQFLVSSFLRDQKNFASAVDAFNKQFDAN